MKEKRGKGKEQVLEMSNQTDSEELFKRYLDGNKNVLKYEYHPVLGGLKFPDYKIYTKQCEILCEITEFTDTKLNRLLECQGTAVLDVNDVLKPIREKISYESRQFSEYRNLNIPCVVVLCNSKRVRVELSSDFILSAMYGNISGKLVINKSGREAAKWLGWYYDRNGKLTNQHQYISAVVVLERNYPNKEIFSELARKIYNEENEKAKRKDSFAVARKAIGQFLKEKNQLRQNTQIDFEKEVLRLRIYHNFRTLVPLPTSSFATDTDEEWVLDSSKGVFVKVLSS